MKGYRAVAVFDKDWYRSITPDINYINIPCDVCHEESVTLTLLSFDSPIPIERHLMCGGIVVEDEDLLVFYKRVNGDG